jgi:hypothetical protein
MCFPLLFSAFVSHQCPWFQWVTIKSTSVTAEVAGSSPVVPAIQPKKIKVLWQVTKSRDISEGAKVLSAFFVARFLPREGAEQGMLAAPPVCISQNQLLSIHTYH